MFIAMNRFKIARGREDEFISIWKNRESYLEDVPGFVEFHLVQGASTDNFTLFATHTQWESKAAFEAWTESEAFRKSHGRAGGGTGLILGPPQFEGFTVVV